MRLHETARNYAQPGEGPIAIMSEMLCDYERVQRHKFSQRDPTKKSCQLIFFFSWFGPYGERGMRMYLSLFFGLFRFFFPRGIRCQPRHGANQSYSSLALPANIWNLGCGLVWLMVGSSPQDDPCLTSNVLQINYLKHSTTYIRWLLPHEGKVYPFVLRCTIRYYYQIGRKEATNKLKCHLPTPTKQAAQTGRQPTLCNKIMGSKVP